MFSNETINNTNSQIEGKKTDGNSKNIIKMMIISIQIRELNRMHNKKLTLERN